MVTLIELMVKNGEDHVTNSTEDGIIFVIYFFHTIIVVANIVMPKSITYKIQKFIVITIVIPKSSQNQRNHKTLQANVKLSVFSLISHERGLLSKV